MAALRRGMVLGILLGLVSFACQAVSDTGSGWSRGGGVLWYPAPGSAETTGTWQIPMRAELRQWPSATVRVGQLVQFPMRTNRAGFAHLFVGNPDGSFFAVAINSRVVAGRWQQLRFDGNVALVAREPAGRTHLTLVVTTMPLSLPAASLSSSMALRSLLAALPSSSWTLARTHVDVSG